MYFNVLKFYFSLYRNVKNDFCLSGSFLGGTSKKTGRNFEGTESRLESQFEDLWPSRWVPEQKFKGFWFSGSWTKEFEGPGSHLKELRRFRTSIWRTWKNFEDNSTSKSRTPKILILESKTKCFGTPKIPETKIIFGSSGFQHGFLLPGRHFEGPKHQSAGLQFGQSYREISSNLDTGIPQGNRLQFGYRNPARKSAPICHPTGNVLIFWELRNLTYTGFPDAWKFSKVILNSYFTFQVFRQLEY
ncbi:uncharacterized protein OCT59_013424 [Rhizophagus irregularis]|uniref:uncharacterized protein n=1 Tax=Rhizophagus irregularis TaxID=588596 RepID=UPI00332EFC86|nr:hypothetical protein OCT59_013424 [Rhizophagus irregularis]